MSGPLAHPLPGGRLHLQHGPIDLIICCDGPGRQACLGAAQLRFATILQELVDDLPALRARVGAVELGGVVAGRMARAVSRAAGTAFATPMAAVAGAVADEVLLAMRAAGDMHRAYVNNGGDIALHLGRDARFKIALAGLDGQRLGDLTLTCDHEIEGIATSGRGGRSLTQGVADSVTVLAESAAIADAAATLIANATDLPGHPAVQRQRANQVDPDSDLGDRLVVTGVGTLAASDRCRALDDGQSLARALIAKGIIRGAALFLQGDCRAVGLSHDLNERLIYA